MKNNHIESIRGIAILLVIFFHICEFLDLPEFSVWRQFHIPFDYLRMPLFTVISGFVYSIRPVSTKNWRLFLGKKIRRLLIPAVVWSMLTFISFTLIYPEMNWNGYLKPLYLPYFQFWFLQSLLLIFIIILPLELLDFFRDVRRWFFTFLFSLILLLCYFYIWPGETTNPLLVMSFFSWTGFFYLLPFFLLGIGIKKFFYMEMGRKHLTSFIVLFLVGILLREVIISQEISSLHFYKDGFFGIFIGVSSTALLMNIKIKYKKLAIIGKMAYPIFLMHILVILYMVYFFRQFLGIYNIAILFPVLSVTSVTVPIIITFLIDQWSISRFIFFGSKKPIFKGVFKKKFLIGERVKV